MSRQENLFNAKVELVPDMFTILKQIRAWLTYVVVLYLGLNLVVSWVLFWGATLNCLKIPKWFNSVLSGNLVK